MNPIEKFCGTYDSREWMRKPVRRDGFLYAMNGHIAVRVSDDPAINAGTEGGDAVIALFEKSVQIERKWVVVPAVIDGKLCGYCEGQGYVNTCPDCEGEGEFEHGRHAYNCRECDGTGLVAALFGTQCPNCLGTKIDCNDGIDVSHAHYAKRYLKLIGDTFQGAEIGVPDDEMGVAMWRADGVIGLLMPLRRI